MKKKQLKPEPYMMNRELSWLKFNERVLNEAGNPRVPLAERLTFASIYQSNLDEFYMVRVGTLMDQMESSEVVRENKTNMTSKEQVKAIIDATRELDIKKAVIYEQLMGELEPQGIRIINFNKLSGKEGELLETYFDNEIAPYLSANIISKQQPFPFLQNKEIYAVVVLGGKKGDKLGIIPCSNEVFKRLIPVPSGKNHYMLVEELILHYIPEVFDHYEVKSKSLIRIIRNADIDVDEAFDDEELDYRDCMKKLISTRKKLCPVKLEHSRVLDDTVIEHLRRDLGIFKDQVFHTETPLELSFLFQIQNALREKKELFYEKRVPQNSPEFVDDKPVLDQICEKDKLLFYPYESMKPFIRLLKEAGNDTRVVSIKMTLYRVARNSQIVEALIDAAENGKEVVVLVELRARFDEENNIEWSQRLEDAGCRLIYGLDHIKVHSKLCQITYMSEEGIRYVTQIGTGNYNEKTSKLYTDLSLMTADQAIGEEAAEVFHKLCLAQTVEHTNHLLVAPNCLQNKLIDKIDAEIAKVQDGNAGYIGVKMNSLTDKKLIDKLIEASMAGVQIDLIVRGICCLIPEVEGYTDNIQVISIVGRYLEHSRIYIFGKGEDSEVYIASADFMTRNTTKRVEVATPVYSPELKERILESFNLMLRDNVKASVLKSDGNYYHRDGGDIQLNSQEYFYADAYRKASFRKEKI